jgi:hypothetical protein
LLADQGVPYSGTCLTTVFLAARLPGPRLTERICPPEGIRAAWRPDRFLQLCLPLSLGWRVGMPLVLLPDVTGVPAGRLYVKGQFVR